MTPQNTQKGQKATSNQDTKETETPQNAERRDEGVEEDDDEPDEWDKRIYSTGCADENDRMRDCYLEKKDWRACADEMEQFRRCWKQHGNEERTSSQDS